ncbi:MAG: AsmA family protein [Paracoccaceae bacterium]
MRWMVRLVALVLVLAVVAVGAVLLIPTGKVAALAAAEFARITGRVLTIDGAVRPTFWPVLGVKTGAVRISNADWSDQGPLLRAEAMVIGLEMGALIGGEVKITEIIATRPVIILERARDGRGNWEFGKSGGAGAGDTSGAMVAAGRPFTLGKGVISGGVVSYLDHETGRKLSVSGIEAEVAIPRFDGPVDLVLAAQINGQAFDLKARIAEFGPFVAGQVVPVVLAGTAGAAKLAFDGRAGFAPLMAAGELDADLGDLGAVMALTGQSAAGVPLGFGAREVSVAGGLTLTDKGSVHLRGGTVVLDGNRLSGDADLVMAGARPKLSAQVAAGALSFAGPASGGDSEIGGAQTSGGWSAAAIDVSGLAAMDAEVALTAESVDLGAAKLGAVRVLITNDRARAVFDIRQMAAYGGTIVGKFVVNGRGGLSVGGDLVAKGLAMQPLLDDVAGYDRLIGTGDGAVKFLGVGNSIMAIMAGLSGSGRVAFGKGELQGLDVAGMLRTLDASYIGEGAKTIFDSIAAGFSIDEGVLRSDDLKLVAPLIRATGAGTVGIGARLVQYRLLATALAAADGTGGVTVPILISGPWADPTIKLDLEYLAQQKLDAEAERLKTRVEAERLRLEAEAAARLSDELGIVQGAGESLEDAARRRAQEALEAEAARALERLLGGGN